MTMDRLATNGRYSASAKSRRIVYIRGDSASTYTIRPWIAGSLALMGTLLSLAFLGATGYLVYRDDLINTAFSRTADLQQAYEDRIASLRSEIDKIASRQVLDQVAYDEKLERVLSAQRALDDRQKLVSDLISRAKDSGLLEEAANTPSNAPTIQRDAKADSIVTGTVNAYASDGVATSIDERFAALTELPPDEPEAGVLFEADGRRTPDLKTMADELARIDAMQTEAVQTLAAAADARADKVVGIVNKLGLTLNIASADLQAGASNKDAMGGPYIPLTGTEALQSALVDAEVAFGRLTTVKAEIGKLPVAKPIEGASMTSNFGSRTDPFLGSAAFHAGVDFRSPVGRAVEATAPGIVVMAGRQGGYGNMVEIDHGKGLTTRYAHLSKIKVDIGDRVARGAVIGLVGSTGRSTGPHLHYETRVQGSAVNPMKYLNAGREIETLLN